MPANLILILLLLALAAYGQQQERVAIIQTVDDGDSIKFSDLSYLTDRLRETAVNVLPKQQFGVMTTESIVAFLGSQENARKVCNESSCLAEVGRKVNADYVAQARIGRFNKNLTIKTELYSTRSGNLVGSFTGDSKDISGLLGIINKNASDLFKKMLDAQPQPSYSSKDDRDKTIADYSQAIKLNPNDASAYHGRGVAYHVKGDYDKAIADFSQAIKLKLNYASYYNRGSTYYAKGDYDKAIADHSQAIKLNPNYADAYNNRGSAYYAKGNYDKAIADYSQAIRLKPDFAEAYNDRGKAYDKKRDKDKAIADFNEAKRLNQK